MEEFKSNSHKSKELAQKKVEKVVTGNVRTKKKSDIQKFASIFVPEDVNSVKDYILMDVIVPLIKKAISDTVEVILYPGGKKGGSNASKISYREYYDRDRRRDYSAPRVRSGYDFDDIIFDTRGEAEQVLSSMDDLIDVYGTVSVADLYDLAGITGRNYTDNKYGWTDIRTARVVRVKEGYTLELPRALPLNN